MKGRLAIATVLVCGFHLGAAKPSLVDAGLTASVNAQGDVELRWVVAPSALMPDLLAQIALRDEALRSFKSANRRPGARRRPDPSGHRSRRSR